MRVRGLLLSGRLRRHRGNRLQRHFLGFTLSYDDFFTIGGRHIPPIQPRHSLTVQQSLETLQFFVPAPADVLLQLCLTLSNDLGRAALGLLAEEVSGANLSSAQSVAATTYTLHSERRADQLR